MVGEGWICHKLLDTLNGISPPKLKWLRFLVPTVVDLIACGFPNLANPSRTFWQQVYFLEEGTLVLERQIHTIFCLG